MPKQYYAISLSNAFPYLEYPTLRQDRVQSFQLYVSSVSYLKKKQASVVPSIELNSRRKYLLSTKGETDPDQK